MAMTIARPNSTIGQMGNGTIIFSSKWFCGHNPLGMHEINVLLLAVLLQLHNKSSVRSTFRVGCTL
jgi:hypothetical protein